jgi:hypothetical protein
VGVGGLRRRLLVVIRVCLWWRASDGGGRHGLTGVPKESVRTWQSAERRLGGSSLDARELGDSGCGEGRSAQKTKQGKEEEWKATVQDWEACEVRESQRFTHGGAEEACFLTRIRERGRRGRACSGVVWMARNAGLRRWRPPRPRLLDRRASGVFGRATGSTASTREGSAAVRRAGTEKEKQNGQLATVRFVALRLRLSPRGVAAASNRHVAVKSNKFICNKETKYKSAR